MTLNRRGVAALHFAEDLASVWGESGADASQVLVGRASLQQAGILKLGYASGQPAAAEQYLLGQVGHADRAVRRMSNLDENVVPGQWDAAVGA